MTTEYGLVGKGKLSELKLVHTRKIQPLDKAVLQNAAESIYIWRNLILTKLEYVIIVGYHDDDTI